MAKNIDKDPWKNRSVEMRCWSCLSFVVKAGSTERSESGMLGRCRRNAPTMRGFPAVFEQDWCGEHRLDETKV